MTNEELIQALGRIDANATVTAGKQYIEATVAANDFHAFMQKIKDDKSLLFDFLICVTGVDYPEYLQMVYHLESTSLKHMLVVKVNTAGRENAAIDSVADLWPTSEFHEREAYDLLGIHFNNHPDLRRLFLDDEWGHPLRKDYKDDVHIVSR